jgi:hypothetical protein
LGPQVELASELDEVESTSETSINFYQAARRNILADSHLWMFQNAGQRTDKMEASRSALSRALVEPTTWFQACVKNR